MQNLAAAQLIDLSDLGSVASVVEGRPFTLLGAVTDPGLADALTVTIDFGDGTAPVVVAVDQATRTFEVTHTYADDPAGADDTYTLSVRASDGTATSELRTLAVHVQDAPATPTALSLDSTRINEGGNVTLSGRITDPSPTDTHTVTVVWGDGQQETVAIDPATNAFSLTHTYADDSRIARAGTLIKDADGNPIPAAIDTTGKVVAGQSLDPTGQYLVYAADTLLSFELKVTFTDADGAVSTYTTSVEQTADGKPVANPLAVTVLDVAPVITVAGAGSLVEGSRITQSLSARDPGADTVVTWTVNWGDGSQAETYSGPTADISHVYVDNGTYTVTVIATDEDGNSGTTTRALEVTNAKPVVTAALDRSTVAEGGVVVLTGAVSDAGLADTHTLNVDWGDGTSSQINIPANDRTYRLTHTYVDDGRSGTAFDLAAVRVTATDKDRATSDAVSLGVTVENVAPTIAALALDSVRVVENGVVRLTGAITDPGLADTHTVRIAWGDGKSETVGVDAATRTFTATHVYPDGAAAGTLFTISATASDDDLGVSVTRAVDVTILNDAPDIVAFVVPQAAVNEGSAFTVSGRFTDDGPLDTHKVEIAWGDGTVTLATVDAVNRTFTASYAYADNAPAGTPGYTVTATVTDKDGATGMASRVVKVNNVAPVLLSLTNSAAEVGKVLPGEPVKLTGTFADPAPATIIA